MKFYLILLTILSVNIAKGSQPDDIFIYSEKETVFGQQLISSESGFISTNHQDTFHPAMLSAKNKALRKAQDACSAISVSAVQVSPWVIHKVSSCSHSVCYGTETGKVVATALFDCDLTLKK